MPLYLPDNYPISPFIESQIADNRIFLNSASFSENPLKLLIVNIMPEAEKYEELILKQLVNLTQCIEICFVKLRTHQYKSSDKSHLNSIYKTFDECTEKSIPDGIIITGAPVELLDFKSISYYNELIEIMNYAKQNIKSTLGICWAGIFIGHYLGIENKIFKNKIFGVFQAEYNDINNWLNTEKKLFSCPQSRYAGIDEQQLAKAAKNAVVNILCKSAEAGSFIFESADHKFVAHLGHPEYEAGRIMFEYLRDQSNSLGINPKYFDVEHPINTWAVDSYNFFLKWIKLIEN